MGEFLSAASIYFQYFKFLISLFFIVFFLKIENKWHKEILLRKRLSASPVVLYGSPQSRSPLVNWYIYGTQIDKPGVKSMDVLENILASSEWLVGNAFRLIFICYYSMLFSAVCIIYTNYTISAMYVCVHYLYELYYLCNVCCVVHCNWNEPR